MTLRSVNLKDLHLFECWFSLLWGSFDKFKHRWTDNSGWASTILRQQMMSFEWSTTWALDLNWGERVSNPYIMKKGSFNDPEKGIHEPFS